VNGKIESTFGPMAAGEDAGYAVELMNRFSPWYELTLKGMDPAEAAKRVGDVQAVYANKHYTKFEQQVMARMFPFYKFTKSQLKHVTKTLAEKPELAKKIQEATLAKRLAELTAATGTPASAAGSAAK
jgi:hypothetical protein